MSNQQILFDVRGDVAVITMNRPERLNAWTASMRVDLVGAIRTANDDHSIGAIVLTGAGRGYCTGGDIKESFVSSLKRLDDGQSDDLAQESQTRHYEWVRLALESKPLIAAVNGLALGGGLSHTLPFDLRIASEEARFSASFINIGLTPEFGSSFFLVQLVGLAHASELCLTGRTIDAYEALRIGLVNRVVPHDALLDTAIGIAQEIAEKPREQVRMIKKLLLDSGTPGNYADAIWMEEAVLRRARGTQEHRKAIQALIERSAAKSDSVER